MNIQEEIMNVLQDDDESIIQIENSFSYYNIKYNRTEVVEALRQLLFEEKIEIQYPFEKKDERELDINQIEDYWFGLTEVGKKEMKKILENMSDNLPS